MSVALVKKTTQCLTFFAGVMLCLGTSCTTGGRTNLCGEVGQPCCASETCDEGARCNSSRLCDACGGLGEPCCLADVCADEFVCESNRCTQALSCSTQCTLGAKRCSNPGGIEVCEASGVCPAWKSVIDFCPNGTYCLVSELSTDCVESCAGACIVSTLLCTASGMQECVQRPTDPCPILQRKDESLTAPLCMAGATAEPNFQWESPTPLGTPIVALAGQDADNFFALDSRGNIIHKVSNTWTYELQPRDGKRQLAISDCGIFSSLMSVGLGGSVFIHRAGGFSEEFVGERVSLVSVACNLEHQAVAVGDSAKIYIRSKGATGTWTPMALDTPGPFQGVALMPPFGKAWLVGPTGKIVRCEGLGAPPLTCVVENSGTAENLRVVKAHEPSGRVFAIGQNSTFISRGTLGTWGPMPGTSEHPSISMVGLGVYSPPTGVQPQVAVITNEGFIFTGDTTGPQTIEPLPVGAPFTAIAIFASGESFISDMNGLLWFSSSFQPGQFAVPTIVAGLKPISENLTDVTSAGNGRLFAVAENGTRYRRYAGSWSLDNGGLVISTELTAVSAVSAQEVYAVGVNGTVYVRRAGVWSIESTGLVSSTLNDIAYDDDHIYAVGDNGVWLEKERHTSVGWHVVNHGLTTKPLNKLAVFRGDATRASEVIAVGDACQVLSKSGTTISKRDVSECPQSDLLAATFSPKGTLLIGGTAGVLMRAETSLGGFEVEHVLSPFLEISVIELQVTPEATWALTTGSGIFKNDGNGWTDYQPGTAPSWMSAFALDEQDGLFGVGFAGQVIRITRP